MNDSDRLISKLNNKERLVAMLAPSFPISYNPKAISSRLKSIGFSYVVEVAVGAKRTNEQAVQILKNNPHSRYITSPCASFVRFMRTKYPELLQHVAFEIDSPMVATAKIVKKMWPDCQPVFIGPCVVKKLESSQDHPELNILVLTYKELETVFNAVTAKAMDSFPDDYNLDFDLIEPSTRIYPIDGGLTDSSGARSLLSEEEIRVVSGWKSCETAIKEFAENKKIRLLDILFCDGGCVMGPGINSNLSLSERKSKIIAYSLSH